MSGRISSMIAEARRHPGDDIEAIAPDGVPEFVRIRANDFGGDDPDHPESVTVSGVLNDITFSLEVPEGSANVELLAVQVVQAIRESASLPVS